MLPALLLIGVLAGSIAARAQPEPGDTSRRLGSRRALRRLPRLHISHKLDPSPEPISNYGPLRLCIVATCCNCSNCQPLQLRAPAAAKWPEMHRGK